MAVFKIVVLDSAIVLNHTGRSIDLDISPSG